MESLEGIDLDQLMRGADVGPARSGDTRDDPTSPSHHHVTTLRLFHKILTFRITARPSGVGSPASSPGTGAPRVRGQPESHDRHAQRVVSAWRARDRR